MFGVDRKKISWEKKSEHRAGTKTKRMHNEVEPDVCEYV